MSPWPSDFTSGQGGGGPQVNKFEQVSSLGYQMSLAGPRPSTEGGWSPKRDGRGARAVYREQGLRPLTLRSNASWIMVTWDPLWTDRHTNN